MSLLDKFRRPDRVGRNNKRNPAENEPEPLPLEVETPVATAGPAAEESLAHHASEQDAA